MLNDLGLFWLKYPPVPNKISHHQHSFTQDVRVLARQWAPPYVPPLKSFFLDKLINLRILGRALLFAYFLQDSWWSLHPPHIPTTARNVLISWSNMFFFAKVCELFSVLMIWRFAIILSQQWLFLGHIEVFTATGISLLSPDIWSHSQGRWASPWALGIDDAEILWS